MTTRAMQGQPPADTPITTQAVRAWWPIAAGVVFGLLTAGGAYVRFDYRLTTLESAATVDAAGRREMLTRLRNVEKMLTLMVCTQQGAGAAACEKAIDATHGGSP